MHGSRPSSGTARIYKQDQRTSGLAWAGRGAPGHLSHDRCGSLLEIQLLQLLPKATALLLRLSTLTSTLDNVAIESSIRHHVLLLPEIVVFAVSSAMASPGVSDNM